MKGKEDELELSMLSPELPPAELHDLARPHKYAVPGTPPLLSVRWPLRSLERIQYALSLWSLLMYKLQ